MTRDRTHMKPFDQFPENLKSQIAYVLTDIDDTLTNNGLVRSHRAHVAGGRPGG